MWQLKKRPLSISVIGIIFILFILTDAVIYDLLFESVRSFYFRRRECFVTATTDALLLYLPFIFIGPKRLWTLWLPVAFVTVVPIAELWYFRNFNELIPGVAYNMLPSVDSVIFKSLVASMRLDDLLYLTPLCFFSIVFFGRRKIRILPSSRVMRTDYIVLAAASFIIAVSWNLTKFAYRYGTHNLGETFDRYVTNFVNKSYDVLKGYLTDYGLLGATVLTVRDAIGTELELSPEQRKAITDFFESRDKKYTPGPDVFTANRSKNLILVIVESWNSTTFDVDPDLEVMPAITSMVNDSSTIFIPHVIPKVYLGRSSDAQLTYNTGLIGLMDEPFVGRFADADYPSLAKALAYPTSSIIKPDKKTTWNAEITSASYGYNSMEFECGYGDAEIDSTLFAIALDRIRRMEEPFFVQITTLRMHDPYEVPGVISRLDENRLKQHFPDARDRNYLQRVRSFDQSLGHFIAGLRQAGLYDNTVVAVVGDHAAQPYALSTALNREEIPLFILNSGTGLTSDREVAQADIFPTLLDIMDIKDYIPVRIGVPYRGVGKSIFDNSVYSDPITPDEVSRLLIKGRFFNPR